MNIKESAPFPSPLLGLTFFRPQLALCSLENATHTSGSAQINIPDAFQWEPSTHCVEHPGMPHFLYSALHHSWPTALECWAVDALEKGLLCALFHPPPLQKHGLSGI